MEKNMSFEGQDRRDKCADEPGRNKGIQLGKKLQLQNVVDI